MPTLAPEDILVTRLKAVTAVTDLVGSSIRPLVLRADDTFPGVTYRRTSTGFDNTAGGTSTSAQATFEIASVAETYVGALALADAVRGALSGWADGAGQIWHLQDQHDEIEPIPVGDEVLPVFEVIQTYFVCYTLTT